MSHNIITKLLGNLIEVNGMLYTVLQVNENAETLLVQELTRAVKYRITLDEVLATFNS